MAIEYKIPITTVSGGNIVPVTTGYYALRISPFSSNAFTGSHVANGVWNFGAVTDGTYQLFYSADNWSTEAQVANFGERYIASSAPTFTTAKASTSVETDVISEKTSGAGVTIDGLLIKDGGISLDTLSEKTAAAGVTIDGVLNKDAGVTCTGASTFSGGVSVTTAAITSTVTPSGANDLVNKAYADALIPYKHWIGVVSGDATTPAITKNSGNLGGELGITRVSEGIYAITCSALFTSGKTIVMHSIRHNKTDTFDAFHVRHYLDTTSQLVLQVYDNAHAVTDACEITLEIKVFP